MNNKTIIISRTDSIGDVVLTLPMAGVIKKYYPSSKIIFLGKTYTKPVVEMSKFVDEFINWDELQKAPNAIEVLRNLKADVFIHVFPNKAIARLIKATKIPLRIGTFGRLHHILTCNKKVLFSRKKSDLHESQLNLKLLSPLGITQHFELNELATLYGFEKKPSLKPELQHLIDPNRFNLILHPKSKGSAKEWGLDNYLELTNLLPKNQFKIFISGTAEEGNLIGNTFDFDENVVSLIGKLSLTDFIAFIAKTDGLVAASTGPLHIAAALNKKAIGLYAPKRPIHPGRWKPVGQHAQAVVFDDNCEQCAKGFDCGCISKIEPQTIVNLLLNQD
ncbi:MAG: glycosyltransferase family 9 protein [Bacteroidetes bacterium]|nr:glycosyltransferase family 9 protein [Bacteroidota bacterium]